MSKNRYQAENVIFQQLEINRRHYLSCMDNQDRIEVLKLMIHDLTNLKFVLECDEHPDVRREHDSIRHRNNSQ